MYGRQQCGAFSDGQTARFRNADPDESLAFACERRRHVQRNRRLSKTMTACSGRVQANGTPVNNLINFGGTPFTPPSATSL